MKKIVAATPADTGGGFGLAGLRHLVPRAGELGEIVRGLAHDSTIGVCIVDERLVDGGVAALLADVDRQWPGLIVVLPAPAAAPSDQEDYALRMIRRAIGYQVRLTP